MSTPQSVRAREIVRGVDVEEQELRVAEAPDLGQREDTDERCAGGSRWRGGRRRRGLAAMASRQAGAVGGAERLDARAGRRSPAAWRRARSEPVGERLDQRPERTACPRRRRRPAPAPRPPPCRSRRARRCRGGRRAPRGVRGARRRPRARWPRAAAARPAPRSGPAPAGRGSARRRPSPAPSAGRRTGWPPPPARTAPRTSGPVSSVSRAGARARRRTRRHAEEVLVRRCRAAARRR